MKPFYILAACLWLYAFSAYSQTNTDGKYVFSKAVVSAYNHNTKAEVFTYIFNDIASLKELNNLPYPPQPVFLWASLQGGVLTACKLWNNNKEYNVREEGHLLEPFPGKYDNTEEYPFDPFPYPYRLSPLYTLTIEGNTATFVFTEPYGSGAYNFPLLGKLTITLVKEENL